MLTVVLNLTEPNLRLKNINQKTHPNRQRLAKVKEVVHLAETKGNYDKPYIPDSVRRNERLYLRLKTNLGNLAGSILWVIIMNTVGVLGAGTMGAGIAQLFASAGLNVVLRDINQALVEKGLAAIDKSLDRQVARSQIEVIEKEAITGRVTGTTDLSDLSACDLVIEAIVENMEVKKTVFAELDHVCQPSAILASNTSSLSITEIASATMRPEKVVGMHFFNPAPVMKLVEIIQGIATSPETVDKVVEISKQIGKQPVEVAEAPGFVVNRILVPMINEAVGILAEGVASAQDIDAAMKLGANHPMGPLTLADMIGLDVCLAVMDVLYQEFSDPKYRTHPLLRKYVRAGWLGGKSGKGFFEY